MRKKEITSIIKSQGKNLVRWEPLINELDKHAYEYLKRMLKAYEWFNVYVDDDLLLEIEQWGKDIRIDFIDRDSYENAMGNEWEYQKGMYKGA